MTNSSNRDFQKEENDVCHATPCSEKADGENRTLITRLETLGNNAFIRHPQVIRVGLEPTATRLKGGCSAD
tara:strand:- start:137 stop:349 length:213 start_codon:yes stop_codon:yes gene_type:complete